MAKTKNKKENQDTAFDDFISNWLSERAEILGRNVRDNTTYSYSKGAKGLGKEESKRQTKNLRTAQEYAYSPPEGTSIRNFEDMPESARRNVEEAQRIFGDRFLGGYDNSNHSIFYPSIPEDTDEFASNRVHEKTHGLKPDPQIETILNYNGESIHNKGIGYNQDYDIPKEIYPRLMEFRYNNKLNPKQKYDAKDFRDNKDIKDSELLRRYNDDFLNFLFNEVAYNEEQDDRLLAAYGLTSINRLKKRRDNKVKHVDPSVRNKYSSYRKYMKNNPDSDREVWEALDTTKEHQKQQQEVKDYWKGVFNSPSMPTGGDLLGMFGNLYGALAPMYSTYRNREGDNLNENYMRNFGRDSLQSLDDSMGYIDTMRQRQLADVALQNNTLQNQMRNSSMGINTMRANQIAGQANVNRATNDVNQQYNQMMMQALQGKAGMQAQRDQIVMNGEKEARLADIQDRDNFYTQLSQNQQNLGKALSSTGKSLGDLRSRGVNSNLVNQLSSFYIVNPMTGKLELNPDFQNEFMAFVNNYVNSGGATKTKDGKTGAYGGRVKAAFGMTQPYFKTKAAYQQMSPEEALAGNNLMWDKARAHVNSNPIYDIAEAANRMGEEFGNSMAEMKGAKGGDSSRSNESLDRIVQYAKAGNKSEDFMLGSGENLVEQNPGIRSGSLQSNVQKGYFGEYGNKMFSFPFGGEVPIEAEGGEVMETPQGQLMDIVGPSHESGGVDLNAQPGSTIYSERIKVGGKTMAQRKKSRVAREERLEKLNKRQGWDVFLRNALERTKEVNAKEEANDNYLQELIGSVMPQPQEELAYGGRVKKKDMMYKAAYGLDGANEWTRAAYKVPALLPFLMGEDFINYIKDPELPEDYEYQKIPYLEDLEEEDKDNKAYGGEVEEPPLKQFEQRLYDTNAPYIQNDDGSISTHKMAWSKVDNRYVAYPTIVQQHRGKLEQLNDDDAFDYAMRTGEFKDFKKRKDAKYYSEGGYKTGTLLDPNLEMLQEYAMGGNVDGDTFKPLTWEEYHNLSLEKRYIYIKVLEEYNRRKREAEELRRKQLEVAELQKQRQQLSSSTPTSTSSTPSTPTFTDEFGYKGFDSYRDYANNNQSALYNRIAMPPEQNIDWWTNPETPEMVALKTVVQGVATKANPLIGILASIPDIIDSHEKHLKDPNSFTKDLRFSADVLGGAAKGVGMGANIISGVGELADIYNEQEAQRKRPPTAVRPRPNPYRVGTKDYEDWNTERKNDAKEIEDIMKKNKAYGGRVKGRRRK